jgi:hypothetical protein
MTKEEIVNGAMKGLIIRTSTKEVIEDAMDAYAKQQAISFANFIAYNDIKPHDIDTWNGGKLNTHELYDDFLQHQFIESQNK